jgi:hypothetical protein
VAGKRRGVQRPPISITPREIAAVCALSIDTCTPATRASSGRRIVISVPPSSTTAMTTDNAASIRFGFGMSSDRVGSRFGQHVRVGNKKPIVQLRVRLHGARALPCSSVTQWVSTGYCDRFVLGRCFPAYADGSHNYAVEAQRYAAVERNATG